LLPAGDPKSRVHHTNIPATCGACHSQQFVMQDGGQSAQMVASYGLSVHGHAVAAGSEKAAVCTDCHGRTRFSMPRTRSRRSLSSTCRRRAANATTLYQKSSNRASTDRLLPRGTGKLPCAPIATGFTPSNHISIQPLLLRRRIWRRQHVPAATKV
jgi:hypothetical protein